MQKLSENKELWDLYCLQHELDSTKRDPYERHLAEYFDIDFTKPKAAQFIYDQGFRASYPNGAKFAACMTHDIDVLEVPKKILFINLIKHFLKGRTAQFLSTFENLLNTRSNDFFQFDDLMAIENKYDCKATYYFKSMGIIDQDFNYLIDSIADIINKLGDNGFEVALHGGHEAYADEAKMLWEKENLEQALGKPVDGYRNHFLRCRYPESFIWMEKMGIKCDSTLAYPDTIGFRNGMCYPYQPYLKSEERFMDLLESPMNLMECSVYKYLALPKEEWLPRAKAVVDQVAELGGVFNFLWHNNDSITGIGFYEEIVAYCRGKGAWMPTVTEMEKWWRTNCLDEIKKYL